MTDLKITIETLKQLKKDELCFSYQEEPEIYRDSKPIYTNNWFWCHGTNWNNLHEVTKRYGYSNAIFSKGKRSKDNVVYLGNLLIYDYDDGITIEEMKSKIESLGISALVVTTLNHQKDKKGVTCDRFRLILQLEECMGNNISTDIMEEILQEIDNALALDKVYDNACKTIERFYSPAPNQQHYYFDGGCIDISTIISEIKKPKPNPVTTPRPIHRHANSELSLKEMREYVREQISYDLVVNELEAKGLRMGRNGGIYLDRKKVGNMHPETRFIRNWAESESMDIIGILEKFYGESYVDNTKRLYEEIK